MKAQELINELTIENKKLNDKIDILKRDIYELKYEIYTLKSDIADLGD